MESKPSMTSDLVQLLKTFEVAGGRIGGQTQDAEIFEMNRDHPALNRDAQRDHAHRLVGSWNACRSVPAEALNNGDVTVVSTKDLQRFKHLVLQVVAGHDIHERPQASVIEELRGLIGDDWNEEATPQRKARP